MKSRFRSDNKGSALILVMIAMTFVGLLGMIIMSASLTNIKMKSVEQQTKVNFYSAESGLDKVKALLEAEGSKNLEAAYAKYLSTYLSLPTEAERLEKFRDIYLHGSGGSGGMLEALDDSGSGINYKKLLGKMKDPADADYYIPSLVTEPAEAEMRIEADGRIILENVRVDFTENGYRSTIKTDIVMEMPGLSSAGKMATASVDFKDYSLLADHRLLVENGTGIETWGNVFAGDGGIVVKAVNNGGILNYTMAGARIITRGDIRLQDSAKLKLGYAAAPPLWPGAYGFRPDIWAANLITERIGEGKESTNTSFLDITGKCYIQNDLKINRKGSYLQFGADSSYFGYSFNEGNAVGGGLKSQNSSAILVNGADSSLDLNGLKEFVLNGRAFVASKADSSDEIYMGESLTTKNTQLAYLIPSKYMADAIRVNPMPKTLYDGNVGNPDGVKGLVNQQLLNADGIWGYLDPAEPLKVMFPAPYAGEAMAYCYFKFTDQGAANQYFQSYFGADAGANAAYTKSKTEYYLAPGGSGIAIQAPTAMNRFTTAGNVLTYDMAAGTLGLRPARLANPDNPGSGALNEARNYQKRYGNLTQTLDELRTGSGSTVFQGIVDEAELAGVPPGTGLSEYLLMEHSYGGSNCAIYIVNNGSTPFFVTNTIRDGIIVASGDVYVQDSYTGAILSAKDIVIQNADIKTMADPNMIKELMSHAANTNDPVLKCFRNYSLTGGAGGSGTINPDGYISVANHIYYENWKKNED